MAVASRFLSLIGLYGSHKLEPSVLLVQVQVNSPDCQGLILGLENKYSLALKSLEAITPLQDAVGALLA